jgi:hypothetical protein
MICWRPKDRINSQHISLSGRIIALTVMPSLTSDFFAKVRKSISAMREVKTIVWNGAEIARKDKESVAHHQMDEY